MNGRTSIKELAKKPEPEPNPALEPEPEDFFEEPSGDGRTARHQVFGLQLIDERKRLVFVPYGSIIWGEGTLNGTSIRFEFSRGEEIWEVVIEGSIGGLQPIVDRLTSGKRESVRVNGESVTLIRVKEIKQEKKAKEEAAG